VSRSLTDLGEYILLVVLIVGVMVVILAWVFATMPPSTLAPTAT
jgi:hypothetical protein